MIAVESKLRDWILRHLISVSVVVVTLLALYARISMLDFVSGDMKVYLIRWFEHYSSSGGISGLSNLIGDYNIPFQTIIALMTYIPIQPVYQYKFLSIVFDFLLAFLVSGIVRMLTQNRTKTAIAYMAAVMLPSVVLNSSLWGQCDSIYTAFCILSLLLILKERYTLSIIALGIAFAFKLQAVFFLPFVLYVYVEKKKFSILNFLWIPLVMILLSLAGIFQGRQVSEVFTIYMNQTQHGYMSVNYPSLWALFLLNHGENNSDFYQENHIYALILTFTILLGIIAVMLGSGKKMQKTDAVKTAFFLIYTCVLFLPNMHERYGYLYIILGLIAVLQDRKMIPAYFILLMIDVMIYSNFLFKVKPEWTVLAAANLGTYCYCAYHILKPYFQNYNRHDERISGDSEKGCEMPDLNRDTGESAASEERKEQAVSIEAASDTGMVRSSPSGGT